jgi:hypothetical protein
LLPLLACQLVFPQGGDTLRKVVRSCLLRPRMLEERCRGFQSFNVLLGRFSSVVTPKPANGGQGKTGQREEAGDSVVLSCPLLWWQVYFRTPTPRTTFEYMTVMEKAIEHGGDGGAIS